MSDLAISFIIPNYNGAEVIGECLRSVFAQSIPCDVIVVDDGSTDESRSRIGQLLRGHPRARLLVHEKNKGFAAAVNTGIRAAETPYVLLFNNDATAAPAMAERMLKAIRRGKKLFSVSACLLQADHPERIDDCGDHVSAFGRAFSPGRDRLREDYAKPRHIQSACAGAALYDREALLSLGAFDEAFGSYLEDVDLGLRAQRAGYRNVYEPSAVAYHKASHTSGSRYNAFKARQTTANTLYMLYKNLPAWVLLLYLPLFTGGFLARGGFYTLKGLSGAYVSGLREGVSKIRQYNKNQYPSVKTAFRRDAMLAIELLGNCFRHFTG
ncbi:MAG: glycosyltransferase family 2 protein [Lachnospiraceae bacterium]|nr:glycosyltransferase family 2 protein [Lachnospiraceae bacterium]